MENMEIWEKVKTPDPKYTKAFNRAGGFKGTATNTQYLVQQATKLWGPNGTGWGLDITHEQYVEGSPIIMDGNVVCRQIIHVIRGFVWYMVDGERKETSPQFGQTTFVGQNNKGIFTDEEAPKKSVTDMMSKCMSLLGFSADIFLGLWDDNKYVNDVKRQYAEDTKTTENPTQEPKEQTEDRTVIDKWLEWMDAFHNCKDINVFNTHWSKAAEPAMKNMPKKYQDEMLRAKKEVLITLGEK